MRITELGDCSMVIMNDSEDSPWKTVGNIYRKVKRYNYRIFVIDSSCNNRHIAEECIYAGRRLILYFSYDISKYYKVNDKVSLIMVV